MRDLSNHIVLSQDYCAYSNFMSSLVSRKRAEPLFSSSAHEVMARSGRSLYVSTISAHRSSRDVIPLGGSSSPPLTMSGVSSRDVDLIGGQYWSVMMNSDFHPSSLKPRTNLSHRQIYSLTRVSSLLTAILNLTGLDAATPINCQVGANSFLSLHSPTNCV